MVCRKEAAANYVGTTKKPPVGIASAVGAAALEAVEAASDAALEAAAAFKRDD